MLDRFGRVDYLVHNAGKSLRRSIHLSYRRRKDLDATAGANYLGPVRMPHWRASPPGSHRKNGSHEDDSRQRESWHRCYKKPAEFAVLAGKTRPVWEFMRRSARPDSL
ncbi:hypothetical protein [Amycolatopsis nigrescens]|uniref:hypothetical protein n=1 Tax=Amycolatopsis nigrescens TaxID=381445 RepID=UPI000376EC6A|nr:hypothetical protein [Amycolatopsis nigrescens]